MTTNDGGPAFPSGIAGPEYGNKAGECMEPGMSLLDYFAAAALSGLLSSCAGCTMPSDVSMYARDAFKLARAMIAEREKQHD